MPGRPLSGPPGVLVFLAIQPVKVCHSSSLPFLVLFAMMWTGAKETVGSVAPIVLATVSNDTVPVVFRPTGVAMTVPVAGGLELRGGSLLFFVLFFLHRVPVFLAIQPVKVCRASGLCLAFAMVFLVGARLGRRRCGGRCVTSVRFLYAGHLFRLRYVRTLRAFFIRFRVRCRLRLRSGRCRGVRGRCLLLCPSACCLSRFINASPVPRDRRFRSDLS